MGNLSTPITVQKLQTALHAKAKSEAGYRFYALYDKMYRSNILFLHGTSAELKRPHRAWMDRTLRKSRSTAC